MPRVTTLIFDQEQVIVEKTLNTDAYEYFTFYFKNLSKPLSPGALNSLWPGYQTWKGPSFRNTCFDGGFKFKTLDLPPFNATDEDINAYLDHVDQMLKFVIGPDDDYAKRWRDIVVVIDLRCTSVLCISNCKRKLVNNGDK